MAITARDFKKKVKQIEKEKKETVRKWKFEELKEKSKSALADENLLHYVILEPKDKVNLTRVKESAFKYVLEKTKNLQKAEELAKATRFLAMMKRDYPIESAELITEAFNKFNAEAFEKRKIQSEPKPEPKDVEIELLGNIIFARETSGFGGINYRFQIPAIKISDWGITTTAKLLSAVTGVAETENINPHRGEVHSQGYLRDFIIQILEEKFGCRVSKEIPEEKKEEEKKSCDNCGRRAYNSLHPKYNSVCIYVGSIIKEFGHYEDVKKSQPCENWILEKK